MANALLWGFHNLKDLAAQRVTSVNTTLIDTAIDQALAEHTRQVDTLLGLFVQPLTDYQRNYKATGGPRSLQPLDEHGRALPRKGGSTYTVGFPIQAGGDAFGQTYLNRAKMTVQEVNDAIAEMLLADKHWMRDHILAALYTNVDWTYTDPEHGDLTVKPLANGDSTTYAIQTGAGAAATDTHFLAQAAGIADATNPYPTLRAELTEHAENGETVIALVPTNLVATTEALATFFESPDPDISPGTTQQLIGRLRTPVPGIVRGKADQVWIVEWASLPDNYIIAVTADGSKPLAMRQHPEPELQGFRRVAERPDYPYYESQYARFAGFGALNRVGAAVLRVGNGAYAIPTGYTAPL